MNLVRNLVYEQATLIENAQRDQGAEGLSDHWEEFLPDWLEQVENFAQG